MRLPSHIQVQQALFLAPPLCSAVAKGPATSRSFRLVHQAQAIVTEPRAVPGTASASHRASQPASRHSTHTNCFGADTVRSVSASGVSDRDSPADAHQVVQIERCATILQRLHMVCVHLTLASTAEAAMAVTAPLAS